jgi:cytochrome c oxidase subunit IV
MTINHKSLYIKTTIVLAILTLIEVGISYWNIPRFSQVGLLLTFALAKMALVAYIFMHLYYEEKVLRRILFIPIPLMIYFLLFLAYDATFTWTIK